MQKSDNINELATALNKVQAELKPVTKSSSNPYYSSKYADLTAILESCKKLLATNGLSVVQVCSVQEGGRISLDTTLLHNSGQWISGELLVLPKPDSNNFTSAQAVGSAITYARRYSFSAIIGIATEDDDGESAMERPSPKKEVKKTPTVVKETRLQRLLRSVKAQGYTSEQMKAYLPLKYGVKTSGELTDEQIIELTVLVDAKLPLEVKE